MPSLILSSQFSTDSQILRETARNLGWETLRLEGYRIPDWFEPPDDQIAIFNTAPEAFEVASQLDRCLVGCPSDWTISLPHRFLSRWLQQMTLADALSGTGRRFVKHSLSKAFPSAVYNPETLAEATISVPRNALVHVGEPVNFDVEYRCFIRDLKVVTICAYLRFGNLIENQSNALIDSIDELNAAKQFANSVITCDQVRCPPAFVLDVGLIGDLGWAVVEMNQCWESGIYSCDPEIVLKTLLRGCVPYSLMDSDWDFRQHYLAAGS